MPPPGFRAELRPYQRQGVTWLRLLAGGRLGGVLADDMGLGKTVQALAWLLAEKAEGRAQGPSLVVAPTSIELLRGAEVDYVQDMMGASFRVNNPIAASSCGCGNSFSVG